MLHTPHPKFSHSVHFSHREMRARNPLISLRFLLSLRDPDELRMVLPDPSVRAKCPQTPFSGP
jgi:hypothetical protein